ncbi:MAG: efflux RND transporter periplasmic adaptor subunit [Ignavibacteriaceae bacterium]|nr:efflux RND transporter periplasmic adaptor subunit [Ignavibacteriaceae bacterium]
MVKLKIPKDYFTLFLLIILVTFFFIACGEEAIEMKPFEVKVTNVVAKDVPITREWVGQTLGAVDIEIRARVDGWLQGIYFTEGSEVREGTLLYKIDATEYEQAVAEAQGNVASIRTLLTQAEDDVKRYTPLAEVGAVSKRDLEIAVSTYEARKGELDAALAALNISQINLGYATVTAPISGLIGISAARVGDFVGRPPNPVILNTISRIDSIHVRFSISEQEYLYLAKQFSQKENSKSTQKRELEMILADGSVYPEKGFVVFTQRQIDPTTGTLQFEASFPNKQKFLRPGQFAKIRTVVEERKGALVIPTRAMIELQGQFTVFVVDENNKVQLRVVKTSTTFGQFTVVDSGLQEGDRVIVEGMMKVKPDMVVAPVDFIMNEKTDKNPGENK